MDLTGFGVFALTAGWVVVAAQRARVDASPAVGLILVTGICLVVGRLLGGISRWLAPALVALVALALLLRSPGGVLSSSPLGGPFGYANASAAFFVQASIAGMMLAVGSRRAAGIVVGVLAAGAFALVPVATRSLASVVLVLAVPALLLSTKSSPGARLAVAASGALLLLVLAATIWLAGAGPRSGSAPDLAARVLSERRLVLWHEAFRMMRDHPATGVGPGRFAEESPTARRDVDARWAHHEYLEQGAEAGIPGLVLLSLLFLWGFARLTLGPPDAVTALAAVALTAIGIHAGIDYVLHFPAVPMVTGALVGSASAEVRADRS